jgi:hypothetical protein
MISNGRMYQWKYDDSIRNANESSFYWDTQEDKFILGDFKKLSAFLIANSGKKKSVEEAVHGK